MSEQEGTAEDFARLLGGEPAEVEPTPEQLAEPVEHEVQPPALTEDEDGSAFLRRLFERKPGDEAFIRSLHGDGAA